MQYALERAGVSRLGVPGKGRLSEIGLEPLEDFPPLEIEQAQADRPGRPARFDRFANRRGGIHGFDLGFRQNGRPEIGAEAEELKPEALKSDGENALELAQGINLEKADGGTHAQLPGATSDAGVELRPG